MWNYKSDNNSSSGYEDIIDILKSYTKEKYINASENIRFEMVNSVF